MCTYTMESVVDTYDNTDTPELSEIDWMDKYVETENIFLDYLKSLTFASFNGADSFVENVILEYDGTESGFDALDNLYELLVSLCDGNSIRLEFTMSSSNVQLSDAERRKQDPRYKRSSKSLSSQCGKELQVNPNRGRSHSSVGVDEILRNQDLVEINNTSESRRKSRRVSLGMRPKFSNWSKVKGAFKRDKSNSRLDSREGDYQDYSGDEGTEKTESQFSSSHENIGQISSSEEEFDYYIDGFPIKKDLTYQTEDESTLKMDPTEFRNNVSENLIPKSKSAIIQGNKSCNSPNINNPSHRNPFKWYRTKSITPTSGENGPQECMSTPPSPYKNSQFFYDDESICQINDDQFVNSVNESNSNSREILQDVQNKYESLQKRLSREFYERYHDRMRNHDFSTNDDEEKLIIDLDDPKLSTVLGEQNLSPAFKQKFQEWQKLKGLSPPRAKIKSENFNALKKHKSDWHKWRPGSKSESNVLRFLDKEPGEFRQETTEDNNFYGDLEETGSYSPLRCKKQTIDIFKGKNNTPVEKKELAWLEKELQKVAREKQRLEKEKEKYAERETRLRNMKRAIKSGRKRKQEVLVPTSTGLFRFQGISSKFTRKLYEWEKAKGITAESSTFALLDSYYGRSEKHRNNKLPNSDVMALLSRSRSVGSVEVTGVGNSMMQPGSLSHQQSSLSLNDMEQLEEAHLQVENDNLMQSADQLFGKENDNELDLISTESLVIPDYHKNSLSRSIPLRNSSIKSLPDPDSDLINAKLLSFTQEDMENDEAALTDHYDSEPEIMFHSFQTDTSGEVPSNRERRTSANADAESIVDQIKKLRAGTSTDDEDRINVLTNLQHLADQLLDMVHIMNDKKTENTDDLAIKIADLAIALKKEIRNLTSDELHANFKTNEALSANNKNGCENFEADGFQYNLDDTYTDTEDNDSPTVHCTFTLPSWRVKYTTPSSTESESSNIRNKYVDSRPNKNDRQRKHFKEDNSSGCDENYDGSDETTLYLDLRPMKNNERRGSSDNISTSNSESIVSSETKDKFAKNCSISPEPVVNVDQEVLHCSLILDGQNKTEVKENYSKEKILDLRAEEQNIESNFDSIDDETEKHMNNDGDNEDESLKRELRNYSPKPITSKRKCSSCGKVKRISKSRKTASHNYCPCEKKDAEKFGVNINQTEMTKNVSSPFQKSNVLVESDRDCSKSTSNLVDLSDRKMGKIFRSKIYDFKALNNSEKSSKIESDVPQVEANSVNVIVPTTRKIFAPLQQDENGGASAVVSFTIDENVNASIKSEETGYKEDNTNSPTTTLWISDLRPKSRSPPLVDRKNLISTLSHQHEKKKSILEMHANVDKLPPASPSSSKRVLNKDNNSSIKMMIAHYNKLICENPEKKMSEGSCWTPTLQKSPVLERRNRFEHMRNNSEMNNIRKSKSAVLTSTKNQKQSAETEGTKNENAQFGILKSSSAGSIRCCASTHVPENLSPNSADKTKTNEMKIEETPVKENFIEKVEANSQIVQNASLSSVTENSYSLLRPVVSCTTPLGRNTSFESVLSETKLRNLRLQEAKKKFFNEYPNKVIISCSPKTKKGDQTQNQAIDVQNLKFKTKPEEQRNSNTEKESNFNLSLNKSVSTGAIDDRTRTYNLTVSEKSPSRSKFGFSSIASKFRKVKMRRHKDPEVSAVSSLCRASLFVNLDKDGKQKEYLNSSKSCPSSPVMQRNISKRNSSSN